MGGEACIFESSELGEVSWGINIVSEIKGVFNVDRVTINCPFQNTFPRLRPSDKHINQFG